MSFINYVNEYLNEELDEVLVGIDKRKEALEAKQAEWNTNKKEMVDAIKQDLQQMENYMIKIGGGVNAADEVQYHLDRIKEVFNKIEQGDNDIKQELEDIEQDEDDIRYEQEREI